MLSLERAHLSVSTLHFTLEKPHSAIFQLDYDRTFAQRGPRGVRGPSLELALQILVLSFRHLPDRWDNCVRA